VEFENKYFEKLLADLESTRSEKTEAINSRDSIVGLETAFESIKATCVKEVLRVKETNDELAKYVETFSNNILTVLIDLKSGESDHLQRLECQIDVIDEMISEAAAKRESVLVKIKEAAEKEKDDNVSPTARMARAALPKKQKKK
jgi:hypothetical protein